MGNKVSKFTDKAGNEGYHFHCPACDHAHLVYTAGSNVPKWSFNGDLEKPTFSPSLRCFWPGREKEYTCHSFIRNGKMEFLNDCTHDMAGKTVELPDF